MKKILIIDIETTGFLNKGGKIVEVGIIELDLDNGKKQIIFDEIVYEGGTSVMQIKNSWIIKNSDLTVDAILNADSMTFFKLEIQGIINSYKLGATAYNNKFDFDFLESRGIRIPVKLACPMLLSTNVLKLKGNYGYKWPSAQEAFDYFIGRGKWKEKHRGADDALHEAEIVYALYKKGIFKLRRHV